MPEGLSTADGVAIDLDAERSFAAAMAVPEQAAQAPDYPRPRRRRDPDAPFGRDPGGEPVAPHGIGANGKPRQNPPGPGRGGKAAKGDDKARIQPATGGGGGKDTPAGKPDYAPQLVEFTDGCWMMMAGTPVPWQRLAGFKVKIRAQAALLKENQPGIVNAVNLGAQHNEQVRAKVEALTTGAVSWILPAMFMLTPFVASSAALWRTDADDAELLELAAGTEADWKKFSAEQIRLMAEASQLAAQAELDAGRDAAEAA